MNTQFNYNHHLINCHSTAISPAACQYNVQGVLKFASDSLSGRSRAAPTPDVYRNLVTGSHYRQHHSITALQGKRYKNHVQTSLSAACQMGIL